MTRRPNRKAKRASRAEELLLAFESDARKQAKELGAVRGVYGGWAPLGDFLSETAAVRRSLEGGDEKLARAVYHALWIGRWHAMVDLPNLPPVPLPYAILKAARGLSRAKSAKALADSSLRQQRIARIHQLLPLQPKSARAGAQFVLSNWTRHQDEELKCPHTDDLRALIAEVFPRLKKK